VYKIVRTPNIDPPPPEQPQFVRVWSLQGVESVPQGRWSMLTPTVVSSWPSGPPPKGHLTSDINKRS
jgi:hypothetical protein